MRARRLLALAGIVSLTAAQSALAGAPLKGVDVKLGRNPGGNAAVRQTDASGHADFGVPPKGDYTLSVAAPPGQAKVHVVVVGPASGPLQRDIAAGAAARAAPLAFSLTGTATLRVSVTAGD